MRLCLWSELVVCYRVLIRESLCLAEVTSSSLWRLLAIGVMCSNVARVRFIQ